MEKYSYDKQLEWLDKRLQHNEREISIDYYKIESIPKNELESICKYYGYVYYETFEDNYRNNRVYKIANFIKKESDKK